MSDRSSVSSRILGACATRLGAGDSLENINTFTLDDGAFCYVTAAHQHFELHRDSTAVPDGVTIIAPIAGPGRWVEVIGVGAQGAQGFQGSQGSQGSALALPTVTTADNGDNLQVIAGTWQKGLNAAQVVQTTADRDALPGIRSEGMLVYVKDTQCVYELLPDLTTWIFYNASPALASQALWEVDLSGSDNNSGLPGHPIATFSELSRRLCPRGATCYLTNDVTVHVNSVSLNPAVSYGELILRVDTNEALPGDLAFHVLNVIHAVISSAPIVLNTITVPSGISSIRGQLTTLAGTFLNQERIRITSGTAAGAVCYSTGLNGSAQDTFVSVLSIPTIDAIQLNGGHGSVLTPLPGDTCVVDTLTVSINRVEITCGTLARVFIQDAKILGLYVDGASRSVFGGSGGNVFISGCISSSVASAWENNAAGAFLLSCRTPSASSITLIGTGWCIIEHAVQGRLALDGMLQSYGITLDGGHLVIGQGTDFNHPGQSRPSRWLASTSFTNIATGGAIEAENGASGSFTDWPAVLVAEGSFLEVNDFNSYCWGASSAYGVAFQIGVHAYIVQGTVADGRFTAIYKIPSTVNFVVANLYFAYSDNPIYIPNSDCGVISASSSFIGNNLNQQDNGFYLTGQSGNHAPTVFPAMTKAGLYQVSGYVATTTVDAAATGNPTLNILFTDDSGVARTVPVAVDPSLTVLGGAGGIVAIESVASGVISWSVTGVTNAGASRYSLRMRISVISAGP